MYVEDIIFGPFTFKQFFILTVGAILSRVIYMYIPEYVAYVLISAIVIIAATLAFRFKPMKIRIEDIDVYMKNKKLLVGEKEYIKILQRKHAALKTEIHVRELKGLVRDNELYKVEEIIKRLIDESASNVHKI